MKRKLLLVCCTVALVLSACGGGSSSNTTETSSTEAVEEKKEEETVEEATEEQANEETVSEEANATEAEQNVDESDAKSDSQNIESTNNETEDSSNTTETENTASTDSDNENVRFENCIVTKTQEFNNGLAWIEFEDQSTGEKYTGCIDKEGNLVFYYTGSFNVYAFEDGYGYFADNSTVYMVNTTGDILSSYPIAPSVIVLGHESDTLMDGARIWGGGYFLYQECHSGFDIAEVVYSIRDVEGKILHSFTIESTEILLDLYYIGGGVFSYPSHKDKDGVMSYYFAKTGKLEENWYSYSVRDMNKVAVNDGYFIFEEDWDASSNDSNDWYAYFTLADINGNVKDIIIPKEYTPSYGEQPVVVGFNSSYVLLMKKYDYYLLYDIKNNIFKKYNGEYADRLYWERAVNLTQSVSLKDETIALHLEGKDGEGYVVLLDMDMKSKCEPIKADSFRIEDNILIISDEFNMSQNEIYDLQGNFIASFLEPLPTNFGEDVMTIENNYVNHDGSRLFDKIDYSAGQSKNIEQ